MKNLISLLFLAASFSALDAVASEPIAGEVTTDGIALMDGAHVDGQAPTDGEQKTNHFNMQKRPEITKTNSGAPIIERPKNKLVQRSKIIPNNSFRVKYLDLKNNSKRIVSSDISSSSDSISSYKPIERPTNKFVPRSKITPNNSFRVKHIDLKNNSKRIVSSDISSSSESVSSYDGNELGDKK